MQANNPMDVVVTLELVMPQLVTLNELMANVDVEELVHMALVINPSIVQTAKIKSMVMGKREG